MRKIDDHVVEGDSVNHQINVTVLDEPGAGGANRHYMITTPDWSRAPDGSNAKGVWDINFQNGPIPETGVNGVTQESLLAVVIDRLRSFQAGSFSCRENAIALTNCEEALMWLQRRTRARIKRGVEGTHQQ